MHAQAAVAAPPAADGASFTVDCRPPFLTVRFAAPQRTLGWSLLHPGFAVVRDVVWVEVRNADLGLAIDAEAFLRSRLAEAGRPSALGLMTSRDIRQHQVTRRTVEEVAASCVATVGLSNAERVGSRRAPRPHFGTINTLVHVDRALTDAALVEAVSIVAQARTAAVLEARPTAAGAGVTGTGTDCIVVACPRDGTQAAWSGLHTAIGEAIGGAVYDAVRAGAEQWQREFAGKLG